MKNKNELIIKIDSEIIKTSSDKFWMIEAKKLIINNYRENIKIDSLINKISKLKSKIEKEKCIIATAITILKKIQ